MNRRKLISSFFILGTIVITFFMGSLVCVNQTFAASPVLLKISHQYAKDDLRDQWANWFAKGVGEKTKGAVKFEIYPASALFKPNPQYDAMRAGALDLTVFSLSYMAGKVPETLITMFPCLPKDYAEASKWRDAKIGKMVEKMCEDNGIKILSWGWMMGGIGSKKKLIAMPNDSKGMKLRGGSKAGDEMLQAAGAAITSMPSSELYFALQSGVLDGTMTSYSSFQSFRLYEVLDHLVVGKNNFIWATLLGITISNKTWDRLNQEQKNAMLETGREIEKRFNDESLKMDGKAAELFAQKGVKVHYLTDQEFKAWEEIAKQSAWKNFGKDVKKGQELIDAALSVR